MKTWGFNSHFRLNLRITNVWGVTEYRCGKHLGPGCAPEIKPVWQPWGGGGRGEGPQISVRERTYWSVATSAGSWQPPAANNLWQQLHVAQTLQEVPASDSTVRHQDYVISAEHGTPLQNVFSVELPVRLVLSFSEPQGSLMLLLPNPSSFPPPFTGIMYELWSEGFVWPLLTFFLCTVHRSSATKHWIQQIHPGIPYLWTLHYMK